MTIKQYKEAKNIFYLQLWCESCTFDMEKKEAYLCELHERKLKQLIQLVGGRL